MDISYLLFLQNIREALGSGVEMFMGIISAVAVHHAIIFIPAIMYWCFNKKNGQFVFFTFGFAQFLNGILKLSVCCYRPWIREPRIIPSQYAIAQATGYSFPSGHATVAGGLFVSSGWVGRSKFRRIPTIILFVFAALVMFSRNYLGVHTPQDVIVGMATGIFAIWIVTIFFNWIDKNERMDAPTLIVAVAAIFLSLLYFKFKSYPIDYVNGEILVDPQKMMLDSFADAGRALGIIVGWFIERRFVKFTTDCSWGEKAARLAIGIALILLMSKAVTPAITAAMPGHIGRFIKGFVELLTPVMIAPVLFIPVSRFFAKRNEVK